MIDTKGWKGITMACNYKGIAWLGLLWMAHEWLDACDVYSWIRDDSGSGFKRRFECISWHVCRSA